MAISASEIYSLAQALCEDGSKKSCEASRRSSASRAYYAALHATMSAIPVDLAPSVAELRGKDSHAAVGDAVTKWAGQVRNGRGEARILARKLPSLKKVRKIADYRISDEFTEQQALDALKEAGKIIEIAAEARRKTQLPAA